MAIEIERKFLVRGDFRPHATSHSRIVQGYLCADTGRTVRVRLRDEEGFLTIKGRSKDGGLSRYEFEKNITKDEALSLLTLALPGVIDKERWLVPHEGLTWEVDVFHGDNEGLVVAEVELSHTDQTVPLPDWVGEEVTGQRQYYNSALTQRPYKMWEP
ncbi:MAG: CYTH domain-containing protein [Bacteroidales bacterium]|nr:CYTH domain-containing protein [Bacteroidales bacterium]